MWPVHTWLPDAHVEAPTAGSVILAGVLLKMGGYGFIRFSLTMLPDASVFFAPFMYFLSIVAIIYTSLVALVQEDMIRHSFEQFRSEPDEDPENTHFLTEITLDNLMSDGALDERDFMDRAQLLCGLHQTVIVSNCVQHKKLISYFSDYKVKRIGLALGVRKLESIITETWQSNTGHILGAFGELFLQNVRFYVYPARDEASGNLITSRNIEIPAEIRFLYEHLLENRNIVDIEAFNPDILSIYHKVVLDMIQQGIGGWEQFVPAPVARLIKAKRLFIR